MNLTEIPSAKCRVGRKNVAKFFKVLYTMLGQRRKDLISGTCKAAISSFWEFIIFTEKTSEGKGQAVNCEFSEEYSPVV